ncbi:MAG: SIR2 family protein [Alphaproteobacteria bacterium]|nr:SIR2 family protein [Alphaproteobacteria bacterium]MCW5739415.1 SIR2 family protein [Alphaproteobacteria bacterium]
MLPADENMDAFVSNWPHFRDRLVVFLGAGASIGAKNIHGEPLMSAYELRNQLWQTYKHNIQQGPFDPRNLRLMGLEHATAIIEAKTGRQILNETLVRSFSCEKPLWQHIVLPYLRPVSIFTTNYDELVEIGYKNHPGLLDMICYDRHPIPGRRILYKPHGSLSHVGQPIGKGGLVITQFDYLEMISDYREMLRSAMNDFRRTCVIIVGYSFGDMDIGAELYQLRKQSAGIPWYAIFPRSDPEVKKMYSKRFSIEQIDRTFEDFLRDLDEHVDFIPKEHKHERIAALQAAGLIQ